MRKRNRLFLNSKTGKVELKITEDDVVREIVDMLWYFFRIRVWRINCPVPGGKMRPNEAGIPDLMGWVVTRILYNETDMVDIKIPHPLFIEVKKPGGRPTPAQSDFIAEAKAAGCIAFFAESSEDCINELRRLGVKRQR